MELEEAIERLKRGIENTMFSTLYSQEQEEEDIKTVLNHLTKQEKMINKYEEMIIKHKEQLKKCGIYGYDYDLKILVEESE